VISWFCGAVRLVQLVAATRSYRSSLPLTLDLLYVFSIDTLADWTEETPRHLKTWVFNFDFVPLLPGVYHLLDADGSGWVHFQRVVHARLPDGGGHKGGGLYTL
jgi:hypothetical protein